MALDEAALDIARDEGVVLLRLYRWEADTVSFGAHEMAARTWDREALEAADVPVVRRPTGGRAVWHARDDLTYSSVSQVPPGTAVRDVYRTTHEELAAALHTLGVASALAPAHGRTPALTSGACFDMATGGEVLVGGEKAIGSAQLVRGGVLLQHGAIARRDPLAPLGAFVLDASRRLPPRAQDVLPESPVIAKAIEARWRARGAEPAPVQLTQRVVAASIRYQDRYQDASWTWRR